jgi:hypothetical protein
MPRIAQRRKTLGQRKLSSAASSGDTQPVSYPAPWERRCSAHEKKVLHGVGGKLSARLFYDLNEQHHVLLDPVRTQNPLQLVPAVSMQLIAVFTRHITPPIVRTDTRELVHQSFVRPAFDLGSISIDRHTISGVLDEARASTGKLIVIWRDRICVDYSHCYISGGRRTGMEKSTY